MPHIALTPGQLSLAELRQIAETPCTCTITAAAYPAIAAAEQVVQQNVRQQQKVYGINTGFGRLANTQIDAGQLQQLQRRLVLSHAAGTGPLLADDVVRLMLYLKVNSLARGYSGVRLTVIEALLQLINHQVYPCIPAKGSVGASGDLAPLAHLSAVLLGEGEVRIAGERVPAQEGLAHAQLQPLTLAAKEGLALVNGTQASTALALNGLFAAEKAFTAALITGALSVDAIAGSVVPFAPQIHTVRGHAGQVTVATILRELLHGSQIHVAHQPCEKVQDPYSIRCQPQVMGACLDYLQFAAQRLLIEANGVTDNPLVFSDSGEILSGGNFHAEPVALAADSLAVSIAEIGALAERRIALLTDTQMSGLPPFLVADAGLNSGFMIAQVTAAALVSENKSLAHPASVDSIPTSANQEDHVSMATYAAKRLADMAENTTTVVAIELLAACQGIELRQPLVTSPQLQPVLHLLRSQVAHYTEDRFFAPDIAKAKMLITTRQLLTPLAAWQAKLWH